MTTILDLLYGTKEIIAEKEKAYEILSNKRSLDEIKDIDVFLQTYCEKIRSFRDTVKQHNYDYKIRLIDESLKNGLYMDDNQIETLFLLLDVKRKKINGTEIEISIMDGNSKSPIGIQDFNLASGNSDHNPPL